MNDSQLVEGDKVFNTNDTKLAAALTAVGFKMTAPPMRIEPQEEGGKRIFVYTFDPDASVDHCGEALGLSEFCKRWKDSKHWREHPDDPLNYMRAALENYQRILHCINHGEHLVGVRIGNNQSLRLVGLPKGGAQ